MARRIQPAGLVVLLAVALVCMPARAQQTGEPSSTDETVEAESMAADALFKEGLDLMRQGRHAEACDKFAASQRFEPSIGARLNLGNCSELLGRLATAYEHFARAADEARAAGDDKRARYAQQRMDELAPRLSYLIVRVAPEARIDGLEVTRDNTPVPASQWNQRIAIDPGVWTIRARAPGAGEFETDIEVGEESDRVEVRVPVLEREAPDGQDAGALGTEAPPPAPASIPAPALTAPAGRDPGMSTPRKLSVAMGAIGVAGLVSSAALGWQARDTFQKARALCDNDRVASCTEGERLRSQQGRDEARATANLATASFAVGLTAAAAAAILWFTGSGAKRPGQAPAPARGTRVQPLVSPRSALVRIDVRF